MTYIERGDNKNNSLASFPHAHQRDKKGAFDSLFDNLLTMDELLAALKHQYARSSIYQWVNRDNMPHRKIRGKLWFPVPEVFEWLERS